MRCRAQHSEIQIPLSGPDLLCKTNSTARELWWTTMIMVVRYNLQDKTPLDACWFRLWRTVTWNAPPIGRKVVDLTKRQDFGEATAGKRSHAIPQNRTSISRCPNGRLPHPPQTSLAGGIGHDPMDSTKAVETPGQLESALRTRLCHHRIDIEARRAPSSDECLKWNRSRIISAADGSLAR